MLRTRRHRVRPAGRSPSRTSSVQQLTNKTKTLHKSLPSQPLTGKSKSLFWKSDSAPKRRPTKILKYWHDKEVNSDSWKVWNVSQWGNFYASTVVDHLCFFFFLFYILINVYAAKNLNNALKIFNEGFCGLCVLQKHVFNFLDVFAISFSIVSCCFVPPQLSNINY